MPSLFEKRKRALELREHFRRVRNGERLYARKLVAVARQVGLIIKGFVTPDGKIRDLDGLLRSLTRYGEILEPWARQVAEQMIYEANRRDKNAWNAAALEIGQSLRREIETAPVGETFRRLLDEQVGQITSIPSGAAARVYNLASEIHLEGRRAEEIAANILATESITVSRAKMLAKTALSSVSTNIVEARARYVGSTHYVWMTSENEDVRRDHKILHGKTFSWDDPPVVDRRSGFRSHPGCNANCQCWAKPILPEWQE